MQRRIIGFSLAGLVIFVCGVLLMPQPVYGEQPSLRQDDPTAQQATIDAAVQERFQATAAVATVVAAQTQGQENRATLFAVLTGTGVAQQTATVGASVTAKAEEQATQTATAGFVLTVDAAFNNAQTATATLWTPAPPTPTATATPVFDPNAFDPYLEGYEAFWSGDFSQAEQNFRDAIAENPQFVESYIGLAEALFSQGNTAGALEAYTQALELGGDSVYLYTVRADILSAQGDYEAAIEDYNRALEGNPQYAGAYAGRANAQIELGNVEDGLADALQALSISPDNAYAAQLTARAYEALDDRRQQRFYERLAEGWGQYNGGDLVGAIETFTEAIDDAEDDEDIRVEFAYYARASVSLAAGDLRNAERDAEQGIDRAEDYGLLYTLLAQAHYNNSDPDSALEALATARELGGDAGFSGLWSGFVHAQTGAEIAPAELASYYYAWIEGQSTRIINWTLPPSGEMTMPAIGGGWRYLIPFAGKAGDLVRVTTQDAFGTSVDPLLVILAPDGTPIYADDDSAGELQSLIDGVELNESGLYTLVVGIASARWGATEVTFEIARDGENFMPPMTETPPFTPTPEPTSTPEASATPTATPTLAATLSARVEQLVSYGDLLGQGVIAAAWSADASRLTLAGAQGVYVYTPGVADSEGTLLSNAVGELYAFSAGAIAYTQGNTITLLRADGSTLNTLASHDAPITALTFTPDGRALISGDANGTVRVWFTSTYAASNELAAATSAITALAVSPPNATGTTVLVVGDAQGRLRRWDLSVPANPAEISGFIGHRSAVTAVAFDGANTLVASGDDSGNVILWDSEFRDEIAALLPHQGAVTALVVSANGDYLITGGADGSVHVISLVDGQTVTTLEVGAAVTQIAPALGAGELALAVVDADGDVHLYATQGLTLPTPTE